MSERDHVALGVALGSVGAIVAMAYAGRHSKSLATSSRKKYEYMDNKPNFASELSSYMETARSSASLGGRAWMSIASSRLDMANARVLESIVRPTEASHLPYEEIEWTPARRADVYAHAADMADRNVAAIGEMISFGRPEDADYPPWVGDQRDGVLNSDVVSGFQIMSDQASGGAKAAYLASELYSQSGYQDAAEKYKDLSSSLRKASRATKMMALTAWRHLADVELQRQRDVAQGAEILRQRDLERGSK